MANYGKRWEACDWYDDESYMKYNVQLISMQVDRNEYIHIENEKQLLFQQLVHRVMYDYGVLKINKVITIDDMCSCLVTLLCKEEDEKNILRNYLTGQSIGILQDVDNYVILVMMVRYGHVKDQHDRNGYQMMVITYKYLVMIG
jgi:hypothetical protein